MIAMATSPRRLSVAEPDQTFVGMFRDLLAESVFGLTGHRNERMPGIDQRLDGSVGAALAEYRVELAMDCECVSGHLLGIAGRPVADDLDDLKIVPVRFGNGSESEMAVPVDRSYRAIRGLPRIFPDLPICSMIQFADITPIAN